MGSPAMFDRAGQFGSMAAPPYTLTWKTPHLKALWYTKSCLFLFYREDLTLSFRLLQLESLRELGDLGVKVKVSVQMCLESKETFFLVH